MGLKSLETLAARQLRAKQRCLLYPERLSQIRAAIDKDDPVTLRALMTTCLDVNDRESLVTDAAVYIEKRKDAAPYCLVTLQDLWEDPTYIALRGVEFSWTSEACLPVLVGEKRKRE